LVAGSGVGKENIQNYSFPFRNNMEYIAVNCGAEGTIETVNSSSDMKKALLLEQQALVKVILKWLTAEQFSRMKWANYP
jgi:hypothetical protein